MVKITTITLDDEIQQLLDLQWANHSLVTSDETKADQGFVTVRHDFELLKAMNEAAPQIIAKDGDELVGYALVMLPSFVDRVPVLKPMFDLFSTIDYFGKKITEYDFYVMGQICVKESHRGQQVFDLMYAEHKNLYKTDYELLITEVATRNSRSMRAHERVGFETIKTYEDETDIWNVVVLPLRK
jgi:hypothetical protein